jgi:hypothetical protein
MSTEPRNPPTLSAPTTIASSGECAFQAQSASWHEASVLWTDRDRNAGGGYGADPRYLEAEVSAGRAAASPRSRRRAHRRAAAMLRPK